MTEKQTATRSSGLTRESGKTTSVHPMVGKEKHVDPAKARHAEAPNAFVAAMPSSGDIVELRQREGLIRVGEVECIMPDSSGFWVAAHGADPRIYVSTTDEHLEIWISRRLMSGHGEFSRMRVSTA
ncbi:MAG: hypothetical protein ACTHOG_09440 [Marmoricola sp.]